MFGGNLNRKVFKIFLELWSGRHSIRTSFESENRNNYVRMDVYISYYVWCLTFTVTSKCTEIRLTRKICQTTAFVSHTFFHTSFKSRWNRCFSFLRNLLVKCKVSVTLSLIQHILILHLKPFLDPFSVSQWDSQSGLCVSLRLMIGW